MTQLCRFLYIYMKFPHIEIYRVVEFLCEYHVKLGLKMKSKIIIIQHIKEAKRLLGRLDHSAAFEALRSAPSGNCCAMSCG